MRSRTRRSAPNYLSAVVLEVFIIGLFVIIAHPQMRSALFEMVFSKSQDGHAPQPIAFDMQGKLAGTAVDVMQNKPANPTEAIQPSLPVLNLLTSDKSSTVSANAQTTNNAQTNLRGLPTYTPSSESSLVASVQTPSTRQANGNDNAQWNTNRTAPNASPAFEQYESMRITVPDPAMSQSIPSNPSVPSALFANSSSQNWNNVSPYNESISGSDYSRAFMSNLGMVPIDYATTQNLRQLPSTGLSTSSAWNTGLTSTYNTPGVYAQPFRAANSPYTQLQGSDWNVASAPAMPRTTANAQQQYGQAPNGQAPNGQWSNGQSINGQSINGQAWPSSYPMTTASRDIYPPPYGTQSQWK